MRPSFGGFVPDTGRLPAQGSTLMDDDAQKTWWRDPSVRPAAWCEAVVVLILAASVLFMEKDLAGHVMHKARNPGWHQPKGSKADAARQHVEAHFGHRKLQGTILMAVEAKPGTPSVLTDAVEQFSHNVSRAASSDPRVSEYKPTVIGYYLDVMGHQLPREVLKSELVSADEKTTLLLLQPTSFGNTDFRHANEFLEEYCSHPPPGYTLHITGMPALGTGNGCFSGVHAEVNPSSLNLDSLTKAETCTMPFSLLVIACLLRNRSKEIQAESESRGLDPQTAAALAAAVVEVEQASNHTEEFLADGSKAVQKTMLDKYPLLVDVVAAIQRMSDSKHGMLLLPSGYAAMLKLCEAVQQVGNVSSMLGPAWLYHQRVDWMMAVSANTNPSGQELLGWYVDGNHALLQVHPTFPSSGAGSAQWIVAMREALEHWEAIHPGYKVELSGGSGGEANILYWLEMKEAMVVYLWQYLSISTLLIMAVVYISFQSVLVPLRLAIALFFTLAATYGAAAIIYQTPLLHGVFPNLRYYDGIYFEVVPLVTGLMIALGLDYDIFLISRIVEFRTQRYSDRASIFRGVLKTGNVISGAGIIMTFSFSGLLFADKVFFQQFGVLLSFSVLFDTFVVRTVLVPALMLIARDWNWWPREMPPIIHDVLEGEVESCGGLSRPMLGGTLLDSVG